MSGKSRLTAGAIGCLFALLATAGCGTSLGVDPRDLPTSEVSGEWESTSTVGALGSLHLELTREDQTRVYDAVLTSTAQPGLGESDGFGTLADGHLILDFGSGATDEYYFEGQIGLTGSVITSIDGQLVFPNQNPSLPVSFTYTGPLPASP